MRRLSPRAAAVGAAAVAGLALSACGSSHATTASLTSTSASGLATRPSSAPAAHVVAPASSTSGTTLEVGDQSGTGAQTLLTASGLISKLPFKVSFQDFTSGPPMLEALSSGHLDIGGVGDAPPIFSAAGGANLAIVGALANGDNDAALLVSPKSGITTIKDLAGKRLAVATGSSGDYHLLTVLKAAGISPHDVTIVNLQPAQALSALASGAIDGWDIGSPFIEEAQSQGDRILVNGDGYGAPYSYEVASSAALKNPAKVAAISTYLHLLDEAHIWANEHPDAWAKVWAKSTGMTLTVMDRAARDDVETPTAVNAAVVSSEQGLVDAFYAAGQIPRSYRFAPYATSAFNAAVPNS